jgi:hypothetical protein
MYTKYTYTVMISPAGRSYLFIVKHDLYVSESNLPKRSCGEAHRATDIHRVPENIEGESLHAGVHEDAKVVAKKCSSDAKCPGGGHHEGLSCDEEQRRHERRQRLRKEWHTRLIF